MNLRAALLWISVAVLSGGCAGGGGVRAVPDAAIPSQARRSAAVTIPYFTSGFKYQGQSYAFSMVGTDPRKDHVTTTVTLHVVPVKLTFTDGLAFDATGLAPGVLHSPLFTNVEFADGTTQFGDALMRGEFWKYVSSHPNYHVLFSAAPIEPTVSIAVPSGDGYTAAKSGGQEGYVTYAWFVQTIEPQIISQLGIPASDFTMFVTARTSVLEPNGNYCCYLGYHSVFRDSSLAHTWTTAWASVTPKSIEPLSHEVAEWLNDPFYNNHVPGWASPESGTYCGNLLEVGDPLTEYHFKRGGFVLQDVAFFSWFARQNPSIGYKGRYDLGGVLRAPAASCS